MNASSHTKCVSLTNQECRFNMRLLIYIYEYNQEFHFCPFAAKFDRYVGSCNALNDLTNKVCVPNKTKDLNLSNFNMISKRSRVVLSAINNKFDKS